MVTVAPGSTPPDSSLTVPEIVPVSTWALAGTDSATVKVSANKQPLPSTGCMSIASSVSTDRVVQAHGLSPCDRLADFAGRD